SPLLYILFVTDPYTPPIYTLSLHDALPICNKHHGYVAVRARAVFHDFAFGKPDKVARAERALMRDQGPLQHIHAVAARVGMRRIDDAGRIAHEAHEHAGVRVGEQFFTEDRRADLSAVAFFPGELAGVDREEGA